MRNKSHKLNPHSLQEQALMKKDTIPPSPYLSSEEAGALLRVSPRTLEKFRVIGGGPRFRKFGRKVLYARSDLETWANQRACASTSDAAYRALQTKA